MSDLPPEEENAPAPPTRERRKGLTSEQRRLLGTPRALSPPPDDESPPSVAAAAETAPAPPSGRPAASPPAEARKREGGDALIGQAKASRHLEMQHAFIVLGILIAIVAIFFAGRKFDAIRYRIMSQFRPAKFEAGPDKFPGLSAAELIEAALVAERQGDWNGAVERFMAAKRKDIRYQGILFRVGKTSYDRGEWEQADRALELALQFGENVAMANHLRATIAVRRHDLAAAERFAAAAANAEPLQGDFYYYWGEILRLNQRPRDAIRRYQEAIQRTPSAADATLCQFKIRLARLEAAEASALATEIEARRQAGTLTLDWLMTDAALRLHLGKIQEAAQLLTAARARGVAGLFDPLVGDVVFRRAAEAYPEIAAVVTPMGAPSP